MSATVTRQASGKRFDAAADAGVLHGEDQADQAAFDVYRGGPPASIDAARRAFVQAGLPEQRLYYDSFDYAPDVLAQIPTAHTGIYNI